MVAFYKRIDRQPTIAGESVFRNKIPETFEPTNAAGLDRRTVSGSDGCQGQLACRAHSSRLLHQLHQFLGFAPGPRGCLPVFCYTSYTSFQPPAYMVLGGIHMARRTKTGVAGVPLLVAGKPRLRRRTGIFLRPQERDRLCPDPFISHKVPPRFFVGALRRLGCLYKRGARAPIAAGIFRCKPRAMPTVSCSVRPHPLNKLRATAYSWSSPCSCAMHGGIAPSHAAIRSSTSITPGPPLRSRPLPGEARHPCIRGRVSPRAPGALWRASRGSQV